MAKERLSQRLNSRQMRLRAQRNRRNRDQSQAINVRRMTCKKIRSASRMGRTRKFLLSNLLGGSFIPTVQYAEVTAIPMYGGTASEAEIEEAEVATRAYRVLSDEELMMERLASEQRSNPFPWFGDKPVSQRLYDAEITARIVRPGILRRAIQAIDNFIRWMCSFRPPRAVRARD